MIMKLQRKRLNVSALSYLNLHVPKTLELPLYLLVLVACLRILRRVVNLSGARTKCVPKEPGPQLESSKDAPALPH